MTQVQEPPAQCMKLPTKTDGTEAEKKSARAVILFFFFSQLVPCVVGLLLSNGLCLHRGVHAGFNSFNCPTSLRCHIMFRFVFLNWIPYSLQVNKKFRLIVTDYLFTRGMSRLHNSLVSAEWVLFRARGRAFGSHLCATFNMQILHCAKFCKATNKQTARRA